MGRRRLDTTAKRRLRPLYLADAEWALVQALMFILRRPDEQGRRPLRTSGQFWRRVLFTQTEAVLAELEAAQDPFAVALRTQLEIARGKRRPGDPPPGRTY